MHRLPIAACLSLTALSAPAFAEVRVTHSVEGRFGVSYSTAGPGNGRSQPFYEGRYNTTFAHQADNGLRFRFDLGVIVGNLDSDRRGPQAAPSLQIGTIRD